MFDKATYWLRRRHTIKVGEGRKAVEIPQPLRGQGEPFNPEGNVSIHSDGMPMVGNKKVSKKALRHNTKRARKAQVTI